MGRAPLPLWCNAHTLTTFHAWSCNDGKIEIFSLCLSLSLSLCQVRSRQQATDSSIEIFTEIPAANSFPMVCSKSGRNTMFEIEISLRVAEFVFAATKLWLRSISQWDRLFAILRQNEFFNRGRDNSKLSLLRPYSVPRFKQKLYRRDGCVTQHRVSMLFSQRRNHTRKRVNLSFDFWSKHRHFFWLYCLR